MRKQMMMAAVTAALMALPGVAVAQGDSMQQQPSSRSNPSMQQQSAQAFQDKDNFKVDGTIASVDPSSHKLMLQRENMPPAQLQLAPDTKIKVNGKEASIQDLQPGSEVRAEFNLSEDQPIAVTVDAKQSKEQQRGMPGGQ